MRRPWLPSFVAALFLGFTLQAPPLSAQQTLPGRETTADSVAAYALSDKMPVDPEALVGTLPNGLRYYVRANPKPAKRAELRLVVKAGSVLEDDDQLGVAHFVEHMQFEGSKHFPGQGIVQFLSSIGMSIGADANAATSFDDTQYQIRVPTDVPGVLDRALTVLEDWAGGATFDQAGIDRERQIVLAEWRMRLGAGDRVGDTIRQVQLEGSRYADRKPIGKPEIVQKVTRDQLLRFYRDWYRPDLMALIIVGDVNRDAVVEMIKQHFTGLSGPANERPRQNFDVPEKPGTRYLTVTDRETTATTVRVTDLRPARNQGTVGGYREILRDQLFSTMLDGRLDGLSQSATPPFLQAGSGRGLFPAPRTKDQAILQALVPAAGVINGLDALLTELQRVAKFGFTATELARAKQAMMAESERVVTESPDRESESRADEYTRNFLQDEALPTIWQELAFHRRLVPSITLQEMNALTNDWFPERNRLVILSAPEIAGVTLPTEAQLAATVKAVAAKKLTAYAETAVEATLIETPPKAGSIIKTTDRGAGITEWTLSNGATVVLKTTKLKEDQILMRAFAPGGTSLASDADFIPARVAERVVPAGGVGRFSGIALDRFLTGKAAGVTPFIDENFEGMGGGCTPQDLETMFQLLFLRFTQPRADATVFAAMAAQARELLGSRVASPTFVFNQTIEDALNGNNPRRQPETPATVDQWNLERSMAFYKARFADASNFTFIFVGSFTVDAIKPLVETYVASLPATNARETWRDLKTPPVDGVIEKTIVKGIAPRSDVAIVFHGQFRYDDAHRWALRAMTRVLGSRLSDAIREELGGTYAITAQPATLKVPQPEFIVRIDWTCDPARTNDLVTRVFQEVEGLRAEPLSAGQMRILRDLLTRETERSSDDNEYFLNQISRRYQDDEASDLATALDPQKHIDALTAADIQQAAKTYLDMSRHVKVVSMPEGK
jgi:zinc protease